MPRIAFRNHGLSFLPWATLSLLLLFICPVLWAAQEAIVIAERAVIYSDRTMSSPVGYVSRGKKVTVGEIPRNRSQVYPIIVSGKIAYIRVVDISTEIESLDSNRLVAERFLRASKRKKDTHYAASLFTYPSQASIDGESGPFTWNGVQILGATRAPDSRLDLGVILSYAEGKEDLETLRMFGIGADASFRIYNGERFVFRWQNQVQGVPFATYSFGDLARVNGYGFTVGSGLNANWVFGDHWGLEIYGGFQYTKLFGFELPDPRLAGSATPPPDITLNPSFLGSRLGAGLSYRY